jgi:hypothetical protein
MQDDAKPWESTADPRQCTSSITMWPVWAPCLTCTLCRPLIVPPSRGCSKHHDLWSGITWWEQFEPWEPCPYGLLCWVVVVRYRDLGCVPRVVGNYHNSLPETSVRNYHFSLSNSQKERSSHLQYFAVEASSHVIWTMNNQLQGVPTYSS